MIKWTQLLHLADRHHGDEIRARLDAASRGNPMVSKSLCEPTLEGSYNGGDLVWHLQFADSPARQACVDQALWRQEIAPLLSDRAVVSRIDSAIYTPGRTGTRHEGLADGIYRVALFAVEPWATREATEQYEQDLLDMPVHLERMLGWSLSGVADSQGERAWTHVWEQEFATLDALLVDYTLHPVHWGHVDRWFDPECPERIVDLTLCHAICRLPHSVLG